MKNGIKSFDIQSYNFQPSDYLLFDANIWLYIYGPQGNPNDWKTRAYSNGLANALRASSKLFIDVLILSEFINRYARIEHNILINQRKANPNFKTFRKSADFKPLATAIANDVRRILYYTQRTEDRFEKLDINSLLMQYEQGNSDFNDQILADLCRSKGIKLVTHDADFKDQGLTIITANNRLL